MGLTKIDMVERIHKETDLTKKMAAELVDSTFRFIKDALSKGEKVKISGLGTFTIRDKEERAGRNPQTGGTITIPSRRVLCFRPSVVLKNDISSRYAHRIDQKGNENSFPPPQTRNLPGPGLFFPRCD